VITENLLRDIILGRLALMGKFQLTIISEPEVTPAEDALIRALLCECFPDEIPTFSHTRYWHNSRPTFIVIYPEHDRVLGHVSVVVREISCDGRPVTVAGVQNVAVTPILRGTGLSHQLMREAMEEAAKRDIPWGMLFCVPALERFYSSLGWQKIEARVTMRDENGHRVPIDPKNITMVKKLAGTEFSAEDIYLEGPDW